MCVCVCQREGCSITKLRHQASSWLGRELWSNPVRDRHMMMMMMMMMMVMMQR